MLGGMPEDYDALTHKVENLRDILSNAATGGSPLEADYRALRAELRAHRDLGPLLPAWLKQNRTLSDWWGYIKPLYGTYAERRRFLSDAFDPALSYLEDMNPGFAPRPVPTAKPASDGRQGTAVPAVRQSTPQENADAFSSFFGQFYGAQQPSPSASGNSPAPTAARTTKTSVFVVHGNDHGPRDSVARLLERLGLEPVILEEQPNKGRTIIEKFVDYSDVAYAVIIMTPDDMGGRRGGRVNHRARQNVILELGFFIGKLGREHVAAIIVDSVEQPSDVSGVLYIKYDAIGGWQGHLAREMKAAGLQIDLNNLA